MASRIAGKILDASLDCFADAGFHGCTTKMIADHADCTEGSLFRLFGSKEKLFEASISKAYQVGRMPNEEVTRILENDNNFERALRKAMLEYFDRLDEKYIRIVVFACLERPKLILDSLFDPGQSLTKAVTHTIEREIYRGNLRDDIIPQRAALQLVLSLWHFALIAPILSIPLKVTTREARRSAVKNFVEIWFRGMQKSPAKKKRAD